MTLRFASNWKDWDTDKKERDKLTKKIDLARTSGAKVSKFNKGMLKKMTKDAVKREAGQIFLQMADEPSIRAAVQRASGNFKSSPPINLLLQDAIGKTHNVTVSQGTHQDEDRDTGGFMLHFDVESSRAKGTSHMYIGQKATGQLEIIKVSYSPDGGKNFVYTLPDGPDPAPLTV